MLRYSQDGLGNWGNISTAEAYDPNADFMVLVNHPVSPISFDRKKIIYFYYEPQDTRKHWGEFRDPHEDDYFFVNKFSFPCWYLNASYSDLINSSPEKTKVMSGVVSGKTLSPEGESREGRELRLKFLSDLDNLSFYHHFGKDHGNERPLSKLKSYKGPLEKKEDGLNAYQYTFAAENGFERNYLTEKLYDAILCECLCFYSGCPNVTDFIDSEAFIQIDLRDPEKAIEVVHRAIINKEWEKRIEVIREEKRKILNSLQVYPLLNQIISGKVVSHAT